MLPDSRNTRVQVIVSYTGYKPLNNVILTHSHVGVLNAEI